MKLQARAKINLHLHVGPRRADGYHSIETLFQEISLHDTLIFRVAPKKIQLRVANAKLGPVRNNLVVEALTLLRHRLGLQAGMDVTLKKQIPVGAGLGGGSSDAAAALKAGWLLWTRLPFSPQRMPPLLLRCARELGADVTFFLRGGRAKAKGIGEKLTQLSRRKKQWMVLVYPRVHVSTPDAYRWIDQEKPVSFKNKNDFEAVVLPRFPAIRKAKEELKRLGCQGVMMSGSGSSVFGFVPGKTAAQKIKRQLSTKPWDVFAVHTI